MACVLARVLSDELAFDADIFQTFGDYQSLAEYYVLDKRIGPLRSWMDRSWHPESIDIKAFNPVRNCLPSRHPRP